MLKFNKEINFMSKIKHQTKEKDLNHYNQQFIKKSFPNHPKNSKNQTIEIT